MRSSSPQIYLIGSLRNANVPKTAEQIRKLGFRVFDDWFAAGEHADDAWRDYEQAKGNSFAQALEGPAANNVFEFDYRNIDASNAVMLVLPAGKSGHLEFGYCVRANKPAVILLEGQDAERFDVMYRFAGLVTRDVVEAATFIRNQLIMHPNERVEARRLRTLELRRDITWTR